MASDDDLNKLPISHADKAFLAAVREQYKVEMASQEINQNKQAEPPKDA